MHQKEIVVHIMTNTIRQCFKFVAKLYKEIFGQLSVGICPKRIIVAVYADKSLLYDLNRELTSLTDIVPSDFSTPK